MKRSHVFLRCGAAMIIAMVATGAAVAAERSLHEMTVRLPDGSLEHIAYSGDIAPTVSFNKPVDVVGFEDADNLFAPAFGDMQRIAVEMDRQHDVIMRMMQAAFSELTSADFGHLPPGTKGYSSITVISNGKTCSQTIRYLESATGGPQVEKASSGDCGFNAPRKPQTVTAKPSTPLTPIPKGNVIEASNKAAPKQKSNALELAGLF